MVAQRASEGRLTINLNASQWEMLVLSGVTNTAALKSCCGILEGISMGQFPSQAVGVATHQPGGIVGARGSIGQRARDGREAMSPTTHNGKRKPKLHLNR